MISGVGAYLALVVSGSDKAETSIKHFPIRSAIGESWRRLKAGVIKRRWRRGSVAFPFSSPSLSQTFYPVPFPSEVTFENAQWRKIKQMQPMWLCLFSYRPFEATFENAQWRKVKQMQPMWLCLFSCTEFEGSLKNAQWRKAKQMQPVWVCILLWKCFKETFENAQWRKAKQMQPVWLCIFSYEQFDETF